MTPQMELYNKAMRAVRISVEWLFGDIVHYFNKISRFEEKFKNLPKCSWKKVRCVCHSTQCLNLYVHQLYIRGHQSALPWTLQPLKIIFLEHLHLFICKT